MKPPKDFYGWVLKLAVIIILVCLALTLLLWFSSCAAARYREPLQCKTVVCRLVKVDERTHYTGATWHNRYVYTWQDDVGLQYTIAYSQAQAYRLGDLKELTPTR